MADLCNGRNVDDLHTLDKAAACAASQCQILNPSWSHCFVFVYSDFAIVSFICAPFIYFVVNVWEMCSLLTYFADAIGNVLNPFKYIYVGL